MERQRLGNYGELLARQILEDRGYRILHRRYKTRYGEIDLIARDGNQLVFIEVKTRMSKAFGTGLDAVTKQKRIHLLRTAYCYLQQHAYRDQPCRFDIIALNLDDRGKLVDYQLITGAFDVEGGNYY